MTMDAAEIDLVRSSMRHIVVHCTPRTLADELVDSGWAELLDAEPEIAIGTLAEELGRCAGNAPVVELVLHHGLGLGLDPQTGVVLPALSRTITGPLAGPLPGRVVDDEVVVDGVVLAGHERARRFLVATEAGVMAVPATALSFRPTGAGDDHLGLCLVGGSAGRSEPIAPADRWASAVAVGRLALAAQLIGLADQMLTTTVEYVLQREQFGRPIGSFQTVKHRLADVRVATVAARSGVHTAWSDGTELSAIAALCLAARAQHLAATHCQQVHGGIAFTVEHGFHRYIRRGQLLSGLLGHPDDLTSRLGAHLIARREVPRTPELV
jgi:Acyl-CoA dehydrogenase, C-terminal domain